MKDVQNLAAPSVKTTKSVLHMACAKELCTKLASWSRATQRTCLTQILLARRAVLPDGMNPSDPETSYTGHDTSEIWSPLRWDCYRINAKKHNLGTSRLNDTGQRVCMYVASRTLELRLAGIGAGPIDGALQKRTLSA